MLIRLVSEFVIEAILKYCALFKMGKEFDFDKLKGSENYHTWAFAVKNFLDYKGLGATIADPVTEKDAGKLTSGKSILSLSVDTSLFVHITKCDSALAIWKVLKSLYEDKGLTRRVGLLKTLINTRLEDCDNMQAYVDKIVELSNKLAGIGFTITDEWSGVIMLAGLTETYRPLIMGIEASVKDITADAIISKLLDAEPDKKSSSNAFFYKNKGQKGQNHGNKVNKDITCHYCSKPGHFKKDCRKRKRDNPEWEAKN